MKQLFFISTFLIIGLLLQACEQEDTEVPKAQVPSSQQKDTENSYTLEEDVENVNEHLDYASSDLDTIYLAGGCFWGVEAFMEKIYGVKEVHSGYANGTSKNPSYQDVIRGEDGFAEAVEVTYDPDRVALETLIDDLFLVIDPTSENQQGNDVGEQYRTGIYTEDQDLLPDIQAVVDKQQKHYEEPIATEATLLKNFYLAEEEHQDYLAKNPDGYCHVDLTVANDLAIRPIEDDKPIIKKLSE